MRKLLPAAVLGATACGVLVSRLEPDVTLHECDWSDYQRGITRRSFKSVSHLLHHVIQLARVQIPLAEVYLLRTISPAFRERIMIVTAMANACVI